MYLMKSINVYFLGSYQKNALKNAKECDVSGDSMKDPTYDNNPIISLEEAGADNVAQGKRARIIV